MTTDTTLTDLFVIQVDGSDVADETIDLLHEILVEDDLAQPAMFTILFHDPQLKLSSGTAFKLGGEITIAAPNSQGRRKTLLVGEITGLEQELEQHRMLFVVRGYDKSHRLYRGQKTRVFLKKSDSEIAAQIAQEAGLSADVESSGVQHEYVMQDSQTDMEFLRARASRIGYTVSVEQQKLKFRRAEQAPPSAPALVWSEGLLSFRSRLSAVAQPNKVEVRSWDMKAKQAITGSASSATTTSTIGYGKSGAQAAQQSFGSSATVTVTDQPVRLQSEATKLAQAIFDDLAGNYLTAEGLCLGEPSLRAGTQVDISGIGTQFSGTYFVTATRHEYNVAYGYRTTFWVSGRRPSSVLGLLDGPAPHAMAGVVPALVTNVNDPDSLGRVKVKFPWLDETLESDWARLVQLGAGPTRGWFSPPEVNDEVLVAFEQGDINRPYVLGGLWNTKDQPPASAVQSGKVKLRAIKSRAGHLIEFGEDEGGNKGYIQIKTAGGNTVTISDTDKGITVASQQHTLKLDDQGRAVKLTSGGTLELSGSGQKLSFTQSGIELSGPGGKLAIAAAGIDLAANANLTMKGNANVSLQANALMDIKTSAIMNIQGTLVKIN